MKPLRPLITLAKRIRVPLPQRGNGSSEGLPRSRGATLDETAARTSTPTGFRQRKRTTFNLGGLATRTLRVLICGTVANMAVPFGAIGLFGPDLAKRVSAFANRPGPKPYAHSTPLSAKEARRLHGKYGENPYLAGQNKWDVMYKGVDVMSGNYTYNATDLSFQGGYGDPVNVTRSYSANQVDEGPFGKGWELSADVRQTAGGVLKKSGAPVRAVPARFQERPSQQLNDPSAVAEDGAENVQPVSAVTSTDASGKPETQQRDMDGVVSTPPWDDNTNNNAVYEYDQLNGNTYQVLQSCNTTTPDGTTYYYTKQGNYGTGQTGGVKPIGNPSAAGQYSNVLKVDHVVDRNGNTTTYSYSPVQSSTYIKANGTTTENVLQSVTMPGGQNLAFSWTSVSCAETSGSVNELRVSQVTDHSRTVLYNYNENGNPGGLLTSEVSPQGRKTQYNYGLPWTSTAYSNYGLDSATNLLTSITDPRGMTTTMEYAMVVIPVQPWGSYMNCPWCYQIIQPNGVTVGINGNFYGSSSYLPTGAIEQPIPAQPTNYPPIAITCDYSGGQYQTCMFVQAVADTNVPRYEVLTYAWPGYKTPEFGFSDPTDCSWDHKVYEGDTQNLLTSISYTHPVSDGSHGANPLPASRNMVYSNFSRETVETDTTYNYLGSPLSKSTIETTYAYPSGTMGAPVTRDSWYAYWDQTKFCQQKAVLANDGTVLSYTDYNPAGGTASGVGMTSLVFEAKYGGLGSVSISGGQPVAGWYNNLAPTGVPSARFWYDSHGRATKVDKLLSQSAATGQWNLTNPSNDTGYEITTTSYGADSSPTWGLATTVIEDAGVLNRTTTTNTYDYAGHATDVTGPTGEFHTLYDSDGLIKSVTNVGTNQTVVSYTYGDPANPTDPNYPNDNGQPTTITDGLTGVSQTITYDKTASDGGYGQVQSVSQAATTAGTGAYTVAYNYTNHGERQFATYTTPNDTVIWQYADFTQVGMGSDDKMAFQTLLKVTGSVSSPVPTAEEEDYAYDTSGRIENAAFAQTPQTGFTPGSGQRWYSSSEEPASRCREFFDFDPAGRDLNLQYGWETFNATSTSPTSVSNITGWNYTYENESPNNNATQSRGLKLTSSLYNGSGSSWTLDHTENYGYEAQRAFLTSAAYADGQPNPTQSWTYNESQNRNDSTTNDLNQLMIGGVCQTDLAGRLQTRNGATLSWDCVSRLIGYASGGVTDTYEYRADGMRDHRHLPGATTTDWSYYHDGQTTVEDQEIQGSALTVTRYGLGARGIDECERQSGTIGSLGTTSTWYPVFDGHGNQCGTLSRSGNNSFSQQNVRSFDAWGNVRRGATTGDPASRYCGSMGHVQDDESGLLYIRARYYDPASGRFVVEDPAMQGTNWFIYAGNDPIGRADLDGKSADEIEDIINAMYQRGEICKEFYQLFRDKSSGLRREIHDLVTGQGFPDEEVAEVIKTKELEMDFGSFETDADMESDWAAGVDPGESFLEQEVFVLEETPIDIE